MQASALKILIADGVGNNMEGREHHLFQGNRVLIGRNTGVAFLLGRSRAAFFLSIFSVLRFFCFLIVVGHIIMNIVYHQTNFKNYTM